MYVQPVTQGEVDKAARISPLALCLVKPPAPELLHSMPVRDQRQLLADWAEATNLVATLTPLSAGTKKTTKPTPRDEGIRSVTSTPLFPLSILPHLLFFYFSLSFIGFTYFFFCSSLPFLPE